MKLNLISTLKNLNTNQKDINNIIAKKEKNKITYKIDDLNHIIKITSPNKLVLNRSNDNLECTMFFELNKTIPSIYTMKEEGYTLEINIKTTYLNITDNLIVIHYDVIDSNESYEYYIEMSENKWVLKQNYPTY